MLQDLILQTRSDMKYKLLEEKEENKHKTIDKKIKSGKAMKQQIEALGSDEENKRLIARAKDEIKVLCITKWVIY